MNAEQCELLQRIESFSFDRPDSALTFSARLARDNGWTLDYAHRAIREYRRFAFLAVSAGHPVTPSDQVDQVWHEHLTYTRSYWDEFCREVLRRPLHHEPTRGGRSEGEKFEDWYARTIESYRRFFGEAPPADLWPPAIVRFGEDVHFARINTLRNWIIPRPAWLRRFFQTAAALAGALMVGGCGAVIAATLNPLDFPGREFLLFFWLLTFTAFSVALVLRRQLRGPSPQAGEIIAPVDPYAAAILNGGRQLAVQAAFAQMLHHGVIDTDIAGGSLRPKRQPAANAPELEKAVYARIAGMGSAKPSMIASFVTSSLMLIEDELRRAAILLGPSQASRARWWPLFLLAPVLIVGAAKILVGMERGKPVGFLAISCVVITLAWLIVFLRAPRRTRKGDAWLKALRVENGRLSRLSRDTSRYHGGEVPLAVGLFGCGVLAGTDLSSLQLILRPPAKDVDGSGGCGSDGGSDGGSSGCGGGGCGGCGGGGD